MVVGAVAVLQDRARPRWPQIGAPAAWVLSSLQEAWGLRPCRLRARLAGSPGEVVRWGPPSGASPHCLPQTQFPQGSGRICHVCTRSNRVHECARAAVWGSHLCVHVCMIHVHLRGLMSPDLRPCPSPRARLAVYLPRCLHRPFPPHPGPAGIRRHFPARCCQSTHCNAGAEGGRSRAGSACPVPPSAARGSPDPPTWAGSWGWGRGAVQWQRDQEGRSPSPLADGDRDTWTVLCALLPACLASWVTPRPSDSPAGCSSTHPSLPPAFARLNGATLPRGDSAR